MQPSAGLQAWNGGQNYSLGLAGQASLSARLTQAEASIAFRGEGLGSVQVHTRVSGDEVGASIAVERHDVRAMLSNDLASLHQALGDKQLRLENVSLQQTPLDSQGWNGGNSGEGSQQGKRNSSGRSAGLDTNVATAGNETSSAGEQATVFNSQGRLSVRA